MIPDFEKFPKIPRLFRDIIITEKIDGTNAQIYIFEDDGPIIAGSRKRWLIPGQSDNFGFGAWVQEHADELRELGPGRHFGEWWGKGIQRGYGLDEKRFSLFNVSRWIPAVLREPAINIFCEGKDIAPACCRLVPVLYYGPFSKAAIDDCLLCLKENGSYAAPGYKNPEGIVVYHTAGNCCFKVTLENDDQPKGQSNDPTT